MTMAGMRAAARANYEAALQDNIPGAVHRETMGRSSIDIPCAACLKLVENAYHSANRMPPHKVAKSLRARGWYIGNSARKHICPEHGKGHGEMVENNRPTHLKSVPSGQGSIIAMVVAEQSATDKAKQAKRLAYDWLTEAFDVEAGQYRDPTITDASIAKDVGLSEKVITDLREEFFGPIKAPSEVRVLMNEVRAAEEQVAALVTEYTAKMDGVRKEIIAIDKRLDALVLKRGWAL
jgi:hypothetical protein